MNATASVKPTHKDSPTDHSRLGFGWKAVLFNCHCHSFDEVAIQLMRAIRCTYERGLQLANVVHHTGCAVVYSGPRERCEAVVGVLQETGLLAKAES